MKVSRRILFAVLLGCAFGAVAQTYPARPIAIVVAFSAGGRAHHKAEIEKWWPIVKQAGIKVE